MGDPIYMLLSITIMVVSFIFQYILKNKFEKYSKIYLKNGLSGKEIAEKMLRDNHIYDVQVISTDGQLTDHYNPINKTINLSESVYKQRTAAAAAVAAHECGHALQHHQAYSMLQLRSILVPIVQLSSNLMQWVIMAGIALMYSSNNKSLMLIGVIMFGLTTLFAFITLPVEYDASNRALIWLKEKNIVTPLEYSGAKEALKWAAATYLIAAIGSLAQLAYFFRIFLNGRRD